MNYGATIESPASLCHCGHTMKNKENNSRLYYGTKLGNRCKLLGEGGGIVYFGLGLVLGVELVSLGGPFRVRFVLGPVPNLIPIMMIKVSGFCII